MSATYATGTIYFVVYKTRDNFANQQPSETVNGVQYELTIESNFIKCIPPVQGVCYHMLKTVMWVKCHSFFRAREFNTLYSVYRLKNKRTQNTLYIFFSFIENMINVFAKSYYTIYTLSQHLHKFSVSYLVLFINTYCHLISTKQTFFIFYVEKNHCTLYLKPWHKKILFQWHLTKQCKQVLIYHMNGWNI